MHFAYKLQFYSDEINISQNNKFLSFLEVTVNVPKVEMVLVFCHDRTRVSSPRFLDFTNNIVNHPYI